MYLVVWSGRDRRTSIDRWTAEETIADAMKVYDKVRAQNSTWTASVCMPIESTDYTTYLPRGMPPSVWVALRGRKKSRALTPEKEVKHVHTGKG
jgi:hypothetical protein